jgi:hypothetical protein
VFSLWEAHLASHADHCQPLTLGKGVPEGLTRSITSIIC